MREIGHSLHSHAYNNKSTTTPASTTTTSRVADEGTVEASDGSFTVALPNTSWAAERGDPGDVMYLVTADIKVTEIDLRVTTIPKNERLGTVDETAKQKARLAEELGATVDPSGVESTTVDGEHAARYTFTLPDRSGKKSPPVDLRAIELCVRHNDVEYGLIFGGAPSAFETATVDYDAIMKSWKWSK